MTGQLGGGGDLLHHPPPGLSGDGRRDAGGDVGVGVGAVGFRLVDVGFDGGELLGEVAQPAFQSVELLVEVVQSLRQRLDPEQEGKQRDVLKNADTILLKGGIKHSGWPVFPQESGSASRLEAHSGDGLLGLLAAAAVEETTAAATI